MPARRCALLQAGRRRADRAPYPIPPFPLQDASSGFTALHYAAAWSPTYVDRLIAKGADVNARSTTIEVCPPRPRPAHRGLRCYNASWEGGDELTPLTPRFSNSRPLHAVGSQTNIEMQLASPLHLAAYHNRPDATELLLEHGAIVRAQTKVRGIHTAFAHYTVPARTSSLLARLFPPSRRNCSSTSECASPQPCSAECATEATSSYYSDCIYTYLHTYIYY